jgi:hypothetical protein
VLLHVQQCDHLLFKLQHEFVIFWEMRSKSNHGPSVLISSLHVPILDSMRSSKKHPSFCFLDSLPLVLMLPLHACTSRPQAPHSQCITQ